MAFLEFFTSETNVQPGTPGYNMADLNKKNSGLVRGKIYSKPCFSLPRNIMKYRDFHATEWNKRQASYGEHVATCTTIYKSKYGFPQTNPNPMKTENWMCIKKKVANPADLQLVIVWDTVLFMDVRFERCLDEPMIHSPELIINQLGCLNLFNWINIIIINH